MNPLLSVYVSTATFLRGRMEALADRRAEMDRGQATTEYIVIILFLAGMVGAFLASGLGWTIVGGIRSAVNQVLSNGGVDG